MTTEQIQQCSNQSELETLRINLENVLRENDYKEHKVVDAVIMWAKSDKPTVASLVQSILGAVNEYNGYPDIKLDARQRINAIDARLAELKVLEAAQKDENEHVAEAE